MHIQPKEVMKDIGEFLVLEFETRNIEEALEFSSFSNMRKMETSDSIKDSMLDTCKVKDLKDSSKLKTCS